MKFKQSILAIPFLFSSVLVLGHAPSASEEADYHFTENIGQLNPKVKFHCKLHIGDLYLEKNQFTFDLFSGENIDKLYETRHSKELRETEGRKPFTIRKHAYAMEFIGANLNGSIIPKDKEVFYKNYIRGNNPDKWYSGASSYEKLSYQDIYPEINIDVYGKGTNLKYDFIIAKGGNPDDIKVAYKGVERLSLNYGILEIELSTGIVKEMKPIAFQVINGRKRLVDCNFKIDGNEVSFQFPRGYNTNYELVIDPTWEFSTLTGSTADNWGYTATFDGNGNFYGGGIAFGNGYPTSVGAYDTTFGGNIDVVITKYNPLGTGIIYSTYIGGSSADQPHSIVTDADSNLVIYGVTSSLDFPTTVGAYDTTFNGGTNITEVSINYPNGTDIFVLKLDNSGAALIGSTYLGGTANDGFSLTNGLNFNYSDHARGEVVLDADTNVYIASSTFSTNYPATAGSHSQAAFGNQDAVVSKLSPNLTNLTWSTYIGGSSADAAYSVRVDTVNNKAFICGGTTSNNIGATAGVENPTYSGAVDGYIAKFDNTNGTLDALTYLGTNAYDQAYIIEVDLDQDVYVVGQTKGSYPVTSNTYRNPGATQFIHKLDNNLTSTGFSTVFGGADTTKVDISLTAFLVDNCDNIYVSGWGGATNNEGHTGGMPTTSDAIQLTTDSSDFYFIVLDRGARNLLYGSYFGDPVANEHVDGGTSRFDKRGTIYQGICAGCGGRNFPTSPGAYNAVNGSSNCNMGSLKIAFEFQGVLAEAAGPPDTLHCGIPFDVTFTTGLTPPPNNTWDFGDGTALVIDDNNPTHTYPGAGHYNVTYVAIDSSSCNETDTFTFNVIVSKKDSLSSNFSFPTIDPCVDSLTIQLNFTGTGADSLFWDMGDGTTFINDTSITYTYSTPGTYPIVFEAYDLLCGGSLIQRDTVFFTPFETTINAVTPPDLLECSGTGPLIVNFTGNNPAPPNNIWDFGDGVGTSTQTNPSYTYGDTGTYNVTYIAIDSTTCNFSDTANFVVQVARADSFDADFTFPPYEPCAASLTVDLEYTGTGADSLFWDFGDPNGPTLIDSNTAKHLYETPGTYIITLKAYDILCGDSATFNDTVFFTPDITLINATSPGDVLLCFPPFVVNFVGNTPSTPNNFWDFGDGIGTSTDANPSYVYADTGTYNIKYIAIDSTTCNIADSVEFTVNVSSVPAFTAQLDFTPPDPCIPVDSFFVDVASTGAGADSLIWDFGDGSQIINDNTVRYTYDGAGTYTITMSVFNFLCNFDTTITNEVTFIDFPDTKTIIPNVFTPNGDGMNDVLKFTSIDNTKEYDIQIFNRWGEHVFQSSDPTDYWDGGKHKEGAYFFIIRYTNICESEEQLLRGYVTLLK